MTKNWSRTCDAEIYAVGFRALNNNQFCYENKCLLVMR